jgi:hypothetical protein
MKSSGVAESLAGDNHFNETEVEVCFDSHRDALVGLHLDI